MAMHVNGMTAGIAIVDNDLHDIILADHKRIRVITVDSRIGRLIASAQSRIQTGYFLFDKGFTVDGEARWGC